LANNKKTLTIGIVIVLLVIIVTVSAAYFQQAAKPNESVVSESQSESLASPYRNGVYKVNGDYISPGGAEQIGVTIKLENGIIKESEVEVLATRETSVEMQNDFKDNFKPMVIGKSIDEVELSKVSGSSLTPLGFNDALDKIKNQAKI